MFLENKTYRFIMFYYYIMNNIKLYSKKQLQDIIKLAKLNNFSVKGLINYKKKALQQLIIDNNLNIPDVITPKVKNKKLKEKVNKVAKNVLSKYNKQPYNKIQQEEFITTLNADKNYINPLLPMGDYFNKKTNTREKVSLVEHQTKFIKQLILSNKRGAICFHGTGTGKTLSAVVSAHWYLKMHPENKVLFICPSAVLFNFIYSMIQYGLDRQANRYRFYTYDKYIRNKELGDNALVIR